MMHSRAKNSAAQPQARDEWMPLDNAAHIYPAEWLLLAAVFVISLLPTMVMTLTMARRDGARR